jgi:hypothetical protein
MNNDINEKLLVLFSMWIGLPLLNLPVESCARKYSHKKVKDVSIELQSELEELLLRDTANDAKFDNRNLEISDRKNQTYVKNNELSEQLNQIDAKNKEMQVLCSEVFLLENNIKEIGNDLATRSRELSIKISDMSKQIFTLKDYIEAISKQNNRLLHLVGKYQVIARPQKYVICNQKKEHEILKKTADELYIFLIDKINELSMQIKVITAQKQSLELRLIELKRSIDIQLRSEKP